MCKYTRGDRVTNTKAVSGIVLGSYMEVDHTWWVIWITPAGFRFSCNEEELSYTENFVTYKLAQIDKTLPPFQHSKS